MKRILKKAGILLLVFLLGTAGTALLLWLGDQISQKGIGNGLSLIIMAGIIATLPQMFIDAFNGLVTFEKIIGKATIIHKKPLPIQVTLIKTLEK